jgi:hypothetical protein
LLFSVLLIASRLGCDLYAKPPALGNAAKIFNAHQA